MNDVNKKLAMLNEVIDKIMDLKKMVIENPKSPSYFGYDIYQGKIYPKNILKKEEPKNDNKCGYVDIYS